MKYQLGDTVILLHSNEEGKVVEIINKEMIKVDVNGVVIPVYKDQVDFPYFKRFTEKKWEQSKKTKTFVDDIKKEKHSAPKVVDGVWLNFLPVMDVDEFGDDIVIAMKLYLINHTEEGYDFNYQLNFFGQKDMELKNKIRPFEDFYIQDLPFSYFNDNPSFEFEFSLSQPKKGKAEYFETIVKLKPKQIFKKIEELQKENKATFSHKLFDTYPDRLEEDKVDLGPLAATGKFKIYDASQGRQHLPPPRSVIDLHIEKLIHHFKGMSNYEILSHQLKEFEKWYELAVAHRQASLIVVHGVGEGVLRDEIHSILNRKKEVKSFVNQHHPSFGFGATEIYFQY